MADQLRWFKVWTSLLIDMDHLSNEAIGMWTRLGCRTAAVGTNGTSVFASREHLATFLKVPVEGIDRALKTLPNVVIEEGENRDGKVAVTFRKWSKYQSDSTGRNRMKALRSKRREEEEKRRSEKTREDEHAACDDLLTPKPLPPSPDVPVPGPVDFLSCETCVEMLSALNEETTSTYTPRGEDAERIHAAHAGRTREFCVSVVRRECRKKLHDPKKRQYLTPYHMFSQRSWDIAVNESGGPVHRAERV